MGSHPPSTKFTARLAHKYYLSVIPPPKCHPHGADKLVAVGGKRVANCWKKFQKMEKMGALLFGAISCPCGPSWWRLARPGDALCACGCDAALPNAEAFCNAMKLVVTTRTVERQHWRRDWRQAARTAATCPAALQRLGARLRHLLPCRCRRVPRRSQRAHIVTASQQLLDMCRSCARPALALAQRAGLLAAGRVLGVQLGTAACLASHYPCCCRHCTATNTHTHACIQILQSYTTDQVR